MAILRRATEQNAADWLPVPEGLWRWEVGKPEIRVSEKYGNYQVRFPLVLTEGERERLKSDHGESPNGKQQSWRSSYSCGLSLGYLKQGQYVSTKLVDFLAACFGASSARRVRDWIARGGGPPTDPSMSEEEEILAIESWLGWVEGCELYGTIRHEPDKSQPGVVWARFGSPMPVGSLPGHKDDDYQRFGSGKLEAMIASSEADIIQRTFEQGDLPR